MPINNSRIFLDIIKYPIITDKTTKLMEDNQYSFAVDRKVSKDIIKSSIESIFDVKVIAVNTCRPPQKSRRVGKFEGNKPAYKKAIVTLAKGSSIDLFSET
nr:ribosomal protein L23 [Porphyropsis coccinea]